MDRADLALVAAASLLFVAPLVYFGELGVWSFDREVSNLEWDEKGIGPQAQEAQVGGSGGGGGTGAGTDGGGSGGAGGGSSSDAEASGSGSGTAGGSSAEPAGSGSAGSGPRGSGAAFGSAAGIGGSSDGGWGFIFGLGSFSLVVGSGFVFWGASCYACWAAFAQAWAAWTVGLACALLVAMFAVLWTAFGVLGGLVAAGGVLLVVYLHSQGLILQGSAAAAAPKKPK